MVAVEISASELRRIEQRSPFALQLLRRGIDDHQIGGASLEECLRKLDLRKMKDKVFEIAEREKANLVYFEESPTILFKYNPGDNKKFIGIIYPLIYTLYRS